MTWVSLALLITVALRELLPSEASMLKRRYVGVDGCHQEKDLLLCEGLPELGDGACDPADLKAILNKVQSRDYRGEKVSVIRSESPQGWLPVPALRPERPKQGPPSSAWQILHAAGVYMLDGFLAPHEADVIVSSVQSRQPITSEVTEPVEPTCSFRRSTTWVFWNHERELKPFPGDLEDRFEKVTHIPKSHYEPMQVVEYNQGDFFSDHYDTSSCDHIGDRKLDELRNVKLRRSLPCDEGSRRQGTLIVYLTDEEAGAGGATYFPKLNVRVTPKKGRAMFFRPTRADGSTDPLLLHSAETLLAGRKLLMQQWMMHGTGR